MANQECFYDAESSQQTVEGRQLPDLNLLQVFNGPRENGAGGDGAGGRPDIGGGGAGLGNQVLEAKPGVPTDAASEIKNSRPQSGTIDQVGRLPAGVATMGGTLSEFFREKQAEGLTNGEIKKMMEALVLVEAESKTFTAKEFDRFDSKIQKVLESMGVEKLTVSRTVNGFEVEAKLKAAKDFVAPGIKLESKNNESLNGLSVGPALKFEFALDKDKNGDPVLNVDGIDGLRAKVSGVRVHGLTLEGERTPKVVALRIGEKESKGHAYFGWHKFKLDQSLTESVRTFSKDLERLFQGTVK